LLSILRGLYFAFIILFHYFLFYLFLFWFLEMIFELSFCIHCLLFYNIFHFLISLYILNSYSVYSLDLKKNIYKKREKEREREREREKERKREREKLFLIPLISSSLSLYRYILYNYQKINWSFLWNDLIFARIFSFLLSIPISMLGLLFKKVRKKIESEPQV
jgi:hypothetical protein